jgi:phosphate/sulfate permease
MLTCTGVSFFHGSNDGQKGMGLIVLVLVGILPGAFALNPAAGQADIRSIVQYARNLEPALLKHASETITSRDATEELSAYLKTKGVTTEKTFGALAGRNREVAVQLEGRPTVLRHRRYDGGESLRPAGGNIAEHTAGLGADAAGLRYLFSLTVCNASRLWPEVNSRANISAIMAIIWLMSESGDDGPASRKPSLFEHLFLHYGAGAEVFVPLIRSRFWNRFCWIVIVLGILGWIAALWFLLEYTECAAFSRRAARALTDGMRGKNASGELCVRVPWV